MSVSISIYLIPDYLILLNIVQNNSKNQEERVKKKSSLRVKKQTNSMNITVLNEIYEICSLQGLSEDPLIRI